MERAPVRTVVSIRQERLPPPGVQPRPWAWDDVLDAPAPSTARHHGMTRAVVRHGLDEDPDPVSRVGYVTIVEAQGGDVCVDERIVVEPRVLAPIIRAERVVSRQLERTSEFGARVVTSTTGFVGRTVGGRPGQAVERGGGHVARALRWASATIRDGLRSIVEAPDRLFAGGESAGAHLRQRRERGLLLRGLLDPHDLTAEGKAAALVLALGGLVALGLAISTFIFFVEPDLLHKWRALLLFFLLGLGSTLVFPFFPELALFQTIDAVKDPASPALGIALAILTISLAMTVGGWLVLFLGQGINTALRKSVSPGSPVARVLDRAEALAAKHGFWFAFLILAIPYGPDTPVFYLLASVRTPTRKYILGAFLGTLTRFTLTWAVPTLYYDVLFPGI